MARKICISWPPASWFNPYFLFIFNSFIFIIHNSYFHPRFFSTCFYLFIFAHIFLHFSNICFFLLSFFLLPVHFILGFVFWGFFLFIYLGVWQYNSLYDGVSPVCLPKCLLFILRGLFALPRGEKGLEIQEKTATGWQWRRGQAKHITQELGHFTAGIHKQMWERLSILPSWPQAEEADSRQRTLLPTGLTANPAPFTHSLPQVYRKKKNLIFAVAFQCNEQLSGDLNRISISCKNVHSVWLFTSSI